MANRVLRHGCLPFVHPSEKRLCIDAENLTQVLPCDSDDFVFGKLQNLFITRAAEKATDQSAIFRRALWKFVVHKSGGQQAVAFTAGNQKTETGWKRRAHSGIVAHR